MSRLDLQSTHLPALPETWFISVPVERVPSIPFWINKAYEDILEKTNSLLDQTKVKIPSGNSKFNLAVRSKVLWQPILNEESWISHHQETLNLKTERFFNPYSFDIGSGRNAIFEGIQYKGIGRNHAASRIDWTHSWGGIHFYEALTEIFFERLLTQAMPEISVPLYGGFLYEEINLPFLIRSSNFLRCEQVLCRMRDEEKIKMRNYICSLFQTDPKNIHRLICLRFIELMKRGFYHRSPTLGNITVDGRLLDHYSIEWVQTNRPGVSGLQLEFNFGKKLEERLSKDELLDFILNNTITKVKHNFDNLNRQAQIVRESFEHFELPVFSDEDMLNEIKTQFPHWREFLIPMEERLRKYPELIRKSLALYDDFEVTQTHYGTVFLRFGNFMSHKLIPAFEHLVKFSLIDKQKINVEDLLSILDHISLKFCHRPFSDLA